MKRFFIKVNGIDKELFKVNETRNQDDSTYFDLNISWNSLGKSLWMEKSNQNFSTLFSTENYDAYKEIHKSSHISVHCNPGKKSNTIKRTVHFKDEKVPRSMCQVTPGIKRDKLFIPIIFRIHGDMNNNVFNLYTKEDSVEIGSGYNSTSDQLRLMLIISDTDVKFSKHEEHPSNIIEEQFSNFNLTIIYSYLNIPSLKQSISLTPFTNKEDYKKLRGLEWWEIYNLYTNLNMFCANELLDRYDCK